MCGIKHMFYTYGHFSCVRITDCVKCWKFEGIKNMIVLPFNVERRYAYNIAYVASHLYFLSVGLIYKGNIDRVKG